MTRITGSIADTGKYYVGDGVRWTAIYESFRDAVASLDATAHLQLNTVALTEVPAHYAFLGDKTLVTNIRRTSWWCSENSDGNSGEDVLSLQNHKRDLCPKDVAEALHLGLRRELATYIAGARKVGILLSGGMDSRVVASVLNELQAERNGLVVTAFCWGDPATRDPIYARQIAERYSWEFRHFPITVDTLKRNIQLCAAEGCFCSPKHLHAMPEVCQNVRDDEIQCLLAGSYGDSIGRAEYSGIRVGKLVPIERTLRNWFGLFVPDVYRECRRRSIRDIESHRLLYGPLPRSAVYELDYQLHYMRNMLGTCMSLFNRVTRFRQAFTHPCVVSLMWSLTNRCRTDEVYKHLLAQVDAALLEIPWARTGRVYLDDHAPADRLSKSYADYAQWVRRDLFDYLEATIFNGEIERLGIFNIKQIGLIFQQNRRLRVCNGRLEEIILWLAALSVFLRDHNWEIDYSPSKAQHYSAFGRMESTLYTWWHLLRTSA